MTKKILVIDDEEIIPDIFGKVLDPAGYDVETCGSGEKGIEMAKTGGYGIIFLDLNMPGMNGIETLRELRKTDKETVIYIMTGYYGNFSDELLKMGEAGIDFELIIKPLRHDQILMVTKAHLGEPA